MLKVGPETTVLIDSAAGSVGSAGVQIARNVGAKRIVGIAGGPAKCDWVVKELKADACVDYKADDFEEQLAAALPDGADRFFDMVGGKVYDVSLKYMARGGLIGVIGAVSTYNGEGYNAKNHVELASKRLRLQGESYSMTS